MSDSLTLEDVFERFDFEPGEVADPREEEHVFEWFDPDDYDRDDELLAQIADTLHVGDPRQDDQLLYFVAAREAGIRRDIDITSSSKLYEVVSGKIRCEQVGYRLLVTDGTYFDPPPGDHPDLNRTEDWNRLKEIIGFDEDDWPMESLGDFIEEVADRV